VPQGLAIFAALSAALAAPAWAQIDGGLAGIEALREPAGDLARPSVIACRTCLTGMKLRALLWMFAGVE